MKQEDLKDCNGGWATARTLLSAVPYSFRFCLSPGASVVVTGISGVMSSVQFSSVYQSCPTLCHLMNCSMPGLPVHHQLPEFTQSHVHPVGDAIQPSHPLSSPSPPAPIPPIIRVFSNESPLHMRWSKYWSFSLSISPSNEHPGLVSVRMDWLDPLQSKGLSRVFSNTTLQKHQFFSIQLSL